MLYFSIIPLTFTKLQLRFSLHLSSNKLVETNKFKEPYGCPKLNIHSNDVPAFLKVGRYIINFNKVYMKYDCLIPNINRLVNMTARDAMQSFMNTFSSCHQIPLYQEDQEMITFIISRGCIIIKYFHSG